ncbi:MAG TPA: hypothetical protein VFO16_18460 [Pseudonocardiaceae bacterium]|nr:hypothetical protein [Pseudonocardiaceae bacterium]
MQTLIKVLGIIALVWIGFAVLGFVLHLAFWLVKWALVIGLVLLVGSVAYVAIKGRADRKALY